MCKYCTCEMCLTLEWLYCLVSLWLQCVNIYRYKNVTCTSLHINAKPKNYALWCICTTHILQKGFMATLVFCGIIPPLTLRPLRTSILVPPAAYISCWGVAEAATHLSAITQSCLLCRVASRERCPTFIPFRHDKNIELYGYCSFVF